MKNLKQFNQFGGNLSESQGGQIDIDYRSLSRSLSIEFELYPSLGEYDLELDGSEFVKAESFEVRPKSKGFNPFAGLLEDLSLVIYEDGNGGKFFQFWYDSTPIATSNHNQQEARSMASTQVEVPLPLKELEFDRNGEIISSVISEIMEMN